MPTLQQDTQSTQTDPNPTGLSSEQLHEIRKELVEFAVPTRDPAALARQVGDPYERLLAEKGSI